MQSNKRINKTFFFFTGFGWLTIKIKRVHAFMKSTGSTCDVISSCDPYVKLFINGVHIKETEVRNNANVFNAKLFYESEKIPKTSNITIQVWDADYSPFDKDDLIQEANGDFDSFLKEPIRKGATNNKKQNFIETVTFWRDEIFDPLSI